MARRRLHNDDWGFESNCFVCEQRNPGGLRIPFWVDDDLGAVVAEFELDETWSGAPTLVHGGVSLAVLDEAQAWATIALASRWALTTETSARFHKPVKVGRGYAVEARVVGGEGEHLDTEASIRRTTDGAVCVEARARFTVFGEAVATSVTGAEVSEENRRYLGG